MATTDITRKAIWEGKDAACMARVQVNAANAVQATVTSVTRKIFDTTSATPRTVLDGETTALTVANVVFDTLQTDGRWTEDSTGYNFRDTLGGAKFPSGGHIYRIEYDFVCSGGELLGVPFELTAGEWFGS